MNTFTHFIKPFLFLLIFVLVVFLCKVYTLLFMQNITTRKTVSNQPKEKALYFLVFFSPVSPVFIPWIFYTFYVPKYLGIAKMNERNKNKSLLRSMQFYIPFNDIV